MRTLYSVDVMTEAELEQLAQAPHGRPRAGYHTADGKRVPGVTTVLGRFKESGGLIHWAWDLGMQGLDYRVVRDSAADAGTLCHTMVDAWIHGDSTTEALLDGEADIEVRNKALIAFGAFREWADQTQLVVTHTEMPLVSETYRFGGTFDAILVKGKRSMGDWKSSNAVYPEYLAQVAAYGLLWEENFPDEPIDGGYHLLRFDKAHGDFTHKWWGELDAGRRYFLNLRAAYEEAAELKQRAK
jgi:hypothetical protein